MPFVSIFPFNFIFFCLFPIYLSKYYIDFVSLSVYHRFSTNGSSSQISFNELWSIWCIRAIWCHTRTYLSTYYFSRLILNWWMLNWTFICDSFFFASHTPIQCNHSFRVHMMQSNNSITKKTDIFFLFSFDIQKPSVSVCHWH